MKLIIPAAWKWTRLRPFTNTTPKPLIKILWKTILEYNLDNLYKYVDEIIIIVKHKKEDIINYLWDTYKWVKISYRTQSNEKWTWAALFWINFTWDLLIVYWDSILNKNDLLKLVKLEWYWALAKEVNNPEKYWILKINDSSIIKEIIEKPLEYIWNLANLGVFKLNWSIFDYLKEIKPSPRWEYELTCAINIFTSKNEFKAIKIDWDFIDIWSPWDILQTNKYFLEKLSKSDIKWVIEDNVTIKWNVILEEWAILKSWTYIEWNIYIWKDASIWPNTYLRWSTVIWDNCKIWNAVEIKNSSLWDNTNVAHLSYIWDSIIWNNVNIWGWFISANLRHDNKNIKVLVKWELVDCWLRKLGCIIWDNVKTGMNTSTYPWRVIENDSFTVPWEIVK